MPQKSRMITCHVICVRGRVELIAVAVAVPGLSDVCDVCFQVCQLMLLAAVQPMMPFLSRLAFKR